MATNSIPWLQDRMSRKEAAAYLGLDNPDTLAVWASTKRYDLPYTKIGRRCLYRRSDLDAFIERRTVRQATGG